QIFELYEFNEDDALPNFAMQFIGCEPYRAIEDYLYSDASSTALPKNYVGNVDLMEGHTIAGWAGNLAQEQPIEVTVWRAGKGLISAPCNVHRKDLRQAGFHSGCLGFAIRLDQPILNRGDYDVCFEQTSILIPP